MIWLTILEAETTPAAADWQQVARGTALVFCEANDAKAAALTARGQMLDLGWSVSAVLSSKPCTPDYIRLIQTEALPALAEAQAGDIGIFLSAEPRTQGNPDSPPTLQPLQSPFIQSRSKH